MAKKRIGIHLTQLANTIGYSPSHLSRVINRLSNPSVHCLEAMGKELGVNMELLWKMIKEGRVYAWKNN